MDKSTLAYLLALKKAPLIGDIMAKKLIRHFGSAKEVFSQPMRHISAVEGMGDKKAEFVRYKNDLLRHAEREIAFIEQHQIHYRIYDQENYPPRLQHCIDGPIVYFEKGNFNHSNPYVLSIVGTRQITSHGSAFLEHLIQEIAPLNPIIVSGYAYGTDILAHRLAIEHGLQTIAVMAHGLNQTYPRNHAKYNNEIMANGGFVTDYWHTDSFDRKNFLGRNRIIAGLSEATIVIESDSKGGSLVTADLASDYHREVFAVPGRVSDKYATGCNNLIKQAKAHLLSKAADIPYILGWEKPHTVVQKQLFVNLEKDEQRIYDYLLERDRELLDLIALHIKIPVHKTASLLMSMELKGVVRPLPGKMFSLA
ncbi:DNA-processing protein DprA [Nonlabens xiamenensis]|uniref:DNA-processing protein DprA n=1 Tax=Nonlabens xiamenensis TaxID=2341043 RepID=UPI000F60C063|nr:DNA-processing protein DprA [Nonlabens xiamenensis]